MLCSRLGSLAIALLLANFAAAVSPLANFQPKSAATTQPKVSAAKTIASVQTAVARKEEAAGNGKLAGQEWTNSIGMIFCWCPAGKFQMGSAAPSRPEFADAQPVQVTLSQGFWIGKFEVTQGEAEKLKINNQYSFVGSKMPMHGVSLNQSDKLLKALHEQERKAGILPDDWEYALPTEAQWEYACRAGTTTRYSFGDSPNDLYQYANYADASLLADDSAMQYADAKHRDGVGRGPAEVGKYRPNAWGIHDMHGNVSEWCSDRYLPQLAGGIDPRGSDDKKIDHVSIRGGSWCSTPTYCEAAFRNPQYMGANSKGTSFTGFRLVLRKKTT